MQFGSHESLEDFAARMNRDANRPMTLVEKLRFPQRVEGGALDSPVAERVMAEAADRIERIAELEAALDELHGASYRLDSGTMAVPLGAWDNAMRVIAGKPD